MNIHPDGGITTVARSGNDTQQWRKLKNGEDVGNAPTPEPPVGQGNIDNYVRLGRSIMSIDAALNTHTYTPSVLIKRSSTKQETFNLSNLDGKIAEMEYRLTDGIPLRGNIADAFKSLKQKLAGLTDNQTYREKFREELDRLMNSSNNIEQILAHDLLEVCQAKKGNSSLATYLDSKSNVDDVIAEVKKKVNDGQAYLDELRKTKLSIETNGLSTKIDDFRRINNFPITDASGGAIAQGKAELMGVNIAQKEKMGASPVVHQTVTTLPPLNTRYTNIGADGLLQTNAQIINHAEQDMLGQFANSIDASLNGASRNNVSGNIYVYVDRVVCDNCTIGLSKMVNGNIVVPTTLSQGSIVQFSKEFPAIELIFIAPKEKTNPNVLRKFKVINGLLTEL